MSLRDSWDIPAPQSEGAAADQKADWPEPQGEESSKDTRAATAREPHWRDFARGEAQDFMGMADRHFAEAPVENEVHALRMRIEDIADQLAGFARQRSETAIARAPAPSHRAPSHAPASRDDNPPTRTERGQIQVIERTIHDIIRHLEASDRHHADTLRQMQGDIQMLLNRGDVDPSDGAMQDMESAFTRIEKRIQTLAARIEAAETPQPGGDMSRIEERLSSLADAIDKLAHGESKPAPAFGGNGPVAEAPEVPAPAHDDAVSENNPEFDGEIAAVPETASDAGGMSGNSADDDDMAEFDLVFEAITGSARAAENGMSADGGKTAAEATDGQLATEAEDGDGEDDDFDHAEAEARLSDFMIRQERRRQRLQQGDDEATAGENPGATPEDDEDDGAQPVSARDAGDAAEDAKPAAAELREAAPGANGSSADLAGEFERRAEMLDARLAERFSELTTRLQSSLREAGDAGTMAGLKSQVGDMAARLDELSARPRDDDGNAELKSQINDLAERLAAAEARFASLDTLESSLGELKGRLEEAEETLKQADRTERTDPRELDRQFEALFEQLEVSRESMLNSARLAATEIAETAAAESAKQVAEDAVRQAQRAAVTAACEAARQAVAEAVPASQGEDEGKIISQLRDSLVELRAEIQSNDRDGRAALDAIEDNLRAMALRLDEFEARGPETREKSGPEAMDSDRVDEVRKREAPGELPEDLAALRLPPLEIGEAPIAENPVVLEDDEGDETEKDAGIESRITEPYTEMGGAESAPDLLADEAEEADGEEKSMPEADAEEASESALKRREPGSGPPSAILDSLGLGLPTKVDKRDISAPTANVGGASPRPEDSGPTPSLGGARTTNELLAAARRAAEAAAAQAPAPEADRHGLRERLRIPLSRKDSKEKPAPAAAMEKPANAVKGTRSSIRKDSGAKPSVRKPILLAAAAVILIAGSFEIYSILSNRGGDVIDATPVVNPELPANAPEASGGQNEIAPGTTQESNVLDGHLPAQGGTAPDIAEPSGEPGAAEPANSAPESGSVEPAKETTSSLSTDPRAEPRPQPQPENVNTAQMPPLPEAVGPAALRQAASDGDPVAQFEVASRLAEGRGIDPDAATAAKWYQLAAASGLAPAQYRLGSLYEKGTGVAKDRSSARIWYERAAEQGNRKAMHNLAVLHADGINGQPDFANAARWFRAAAELGLNDSQYNLGILHVRGLGVPQNLAEAYKWFAILASHGDKDAAARRDAVAGQMDASAVAAARLAAKTWKAKPLIAQANAVRLPDAGWASPEPASNPALPGPEIIRTAQKLLSLGGYQPGPADGRWGPMTQTAIRTFQRDAGLEATGELTPDLLQKMHSRLAG